MSLMSMTGFARADGQGHGANWYWEVRTVNGRGLDVRLRLPTGAEALEVPVRERVATALVRGNVTLTLYQHRQTPQTEVRINETVLAQMLEIAKRLQKQLEAPPLTVEGVLGVRGVLEVVEIDEAEELIAARRAAQLEDLDRALAGLVRARAGEGQRLGGVIQDQLRAISKILEDIDKTPARQPAAILERLKEAVARTLDARTADLDPTRLHQEALLLATKADIEEELQRLRAHLAAAGELISEGQGVGRRLDFLIQEFNREANTLCAKANDSTVTRLGLDLKAVIEQMREQVQNIE